MIKRLLLVCCAAVAAWAQSPIRPDLEGLLYPPLARSARIEGQVRFVIKAGDIQLVSGHPILVPISKANMEKWAIRQAADKQLWVTYTFRLNPNRYVEKRELVGDSVDRFFLRLFHRSVWRTVKLEVCDNRSGTVNVVNGIAEGHPSIEIEVRADMACEINVSDLEAV